MLTKGSQGHKNKLHISTMRRVGYFNVQKNSNLYSLRLNERLLVYKFYTTNEGFTVNLNIRFACQQSWRIYDELHRGILSRTQQLIHNEWRADAQLCAGSL